VTQEPGYAIGVDVGTSNTVAVVRWPDGRTRPLLFDGVPVMPSAVYLDEAGRLHVGRDALRMAALDPARLEPNPKRRVDEATVLLGDREISTVDLLAAILATVARAAFEAIGFLPPAALTYPAAWGSRRREMLAAAATRAGWPPVRFVPEPVAAARYFASVLRRPVPVGRALGVFDFGGGTLDVAVVRNDGPNGFVVLGDGGLPDLGGLDVDAGLVAHLGGLLERTEPIAWQPIAAAAGTSTQLRQRRLFWDDVRGAKEMLSRTPVAPVPVPGVEQAVHVTREELERVAGPLLQRAVFETAGVIERCGLRPDELVGLFLVGGSSRLPIVARMLHANLGIAPTVLEQPELPVAEGALAELVPMVTSAAMATDPTGQLEAPTGPIPTAPISPVSGSPSYGSPASGPFPSPSSGRPSSGPPSSGPPWTGGGPARTPWYRQRALKFAGVAVVVVIVLVVGTVLFLNRSPYHEVNFTSNLAEPTRIPLGTSASVNSEMSVLDGAAAYYAFAHDKSLTVRGYDTAAKKQQWSVDITPSGGGNADWNWMQVLNGKVLMIEAHVYGGGDSSQPFIEYGYDTSNGHQLWQHPVGDKDQWLTAGDSIVYVNHATKALKLTGINPRTGATTWTVTPPSGDGGLNVFGVTADGDAGTVNAVNYNPDQDGSDSRIVAINPDRSAVVIDATSGKQLASQSNVGDYDDDYLAYGDRLYTGAKSAGYAVNSYNLKDLKGQKVAYRTPDSTRALTQGGIFACGGRICVADQAGYDDKTTTVREVDPDSARQLWQYGAPQATSIREVDDKVLVSGDSSHQFNTLLDNKGKTIASDAGDAAGYWVRLNPLSLLVFSDPPSSGLADLTLTGIGAQSKKRTNMGQVRQVRGDSCSWTEKLLFCGARNGEDDGFAYWKLSS
jgi:hypothetical protein